MNYFLPSALLALTTFIAGCGGGSAEDNQQVSQVQVKSLAYGKLAVIQIAGQYLRVDMKAETGLCKNPVFNAVQSVPELAVLNCTVTAVGEQPLTIKSTQGETLYQGALTVPKPHVGLITSAGNITLELDPVAAPVTVNNFLSYVNNGYYRSTLFHRIVAGFVTQGGGYIAGMTKKPGQLAPIALESNNGLFNTRGSLVMARTAVPNSATSEFFINLVDNSSLNYQSEANPGYAVFGKVVQGMDVVDAMGATPTATFNGFANVPVKDVTINLALQTQ